MNDKDYRLYIVLEKADALAKSVAKYGRDVAELRMSPDYFQTVKEVIYSRHGVHIGEIPSSEGKGYLIYRKRFQLEAYRMLGLRMGDDTENGFLRHYFAGLMNGYGGQEIEEFVSDKQDSETGFSDNLKPFHIVYEKRFLPVGTVDTHVHVVRELEHAYYYKSSEYKDKMMAKDKGIVGFSFEISEYASRQELAKVYTMEQMAEMFPDIKRFMTYM